MSQMSAFSDEDCVVIMKLWEDYGQAFGAQDADGIAALFAQDGDLIGLEGRLVSGPEAIAEFYRNEFSRSFEGLSLRDFEFDSPRPLSPQVGLVNGGWIVDGVAVVAWIHYSPRFCSVTPFVRPVLLEDACQETNFATEG